MAVLGAQLIITLVTISVIQKLGPHFSLGRWILCSTGLIRYLYPTDSELRQLANVSKEKSKQKKGGKLITNGKSESFHIPRNLDVQLETAKVTRLDVVHLKYYSDFQWLMDFSVYAMAVYILTEVYQSFYPLKDEVNLSMMWCTLVLFFAVKLLLSLTIQYFQGEDSIGERSTCIVMGFAYLLIAMIILIVDENVLELGLENAYNSFNNSASAFLATQGVSSSGPASKIVLKFFLALWCGILGALFIFPGLRIAKMHWDLLRYFRDNKFKQTALNLTFALPFILVVLWIRPVARDYLTERIFAGRSEPLMKVSTFETVRIAAIVGTMMLKLILMPWYLQAYLDMAYHRAEEQKKEAGRITNTEYQKKIAAVFYYLCVVALQYVAPVIMCLYLTFMYKTLGAYSWIGEETMDNTECSAKNSLAPTTWNETEDGSTTKTITQSAQEIHFALDNLKMVFSVDVFRGLLGFSTWWCCFLYFTTSAIGLVYQTYFTVS